MKIKASLPDKLGAIRKAGFDGIELSMPDIIDYGKLLSGSQPKEDDYDMLAGVAKQIKSLADELGLKIMMLQPFANFEGWKKGEHDEQRKKAFDKARGWVKVMEAAGITLLQVRFASSFILLVANSHRWDHPTLREFHLHSTTWPPISQN
jgi:sugar phosphate isomerase/epimerase